MFNLRSLALAGAFFVLLPGGWLALPGSGETIDVYGEVMALVEDLRLVDPPRSVSKDKWEMVPEQLVEGHTTFAVLEHTVRTTPPEEGSLNITGFVHCEHEVDIRYTPWFGIPIPTRVERIEARCQVGERVIVTPSPWSASTSPMSSTGRFVPITTPAGQRGFAEELKFTALAETAPGRAEERTYYAWAVPIFDEWQDEHGLPKNLWAPLPLDRLQEMGEHDFRILKEESVRR